MDVELPLWYNARTPNSLTGGANQSFIEGGKTSGGIHEIVTDPMPAYEVWDTPVIWQNNQQNTF